MLSPGFAGVTDRGMKRFRNEDRFAIRTAGETNILVVCDGVSSSHESQLASTAAAESVAESLLHVNGADPAQAMRQAIESAGAVVAGLGKESRENPPSTTVVAAIVRDGQVTVGWAGDSRAYWVGNGSTRQITTDHASPTESHAIFRWLGADAPSDEAPDVLQFAIEEPGALVLCSDGLWNYLSSPHELQELVESEQDALALTRRLVEFACGRGGVDNVTAVALRIGDIHGERV